MTCVGPGLFYPRVTHVCLVQTKTQRRLYPDKTCVALDTLSLFRTVHFVFWANLDPRFLLIDYFLYFHYIISYNVVVVRYLEYTQMSAPWVCKSCQYQPVSNPCLIKVGQEVESNNPTLSY